MKKPVHSLMRSLAVAGAIGALALAGLHHPTASTAAPTARTLTMMTWNIHHAESPDNPGVTDIERIAAVIRAEDADLVTLNEVHDDEGEAGHGHQPAELAALLEDDGYHYVQSGVTEVHEGHGETVNMVLSKYPIYTDPADPRAPENFRLPTEHVDPGGKARRALLKVTVKVPGAGDVGVHATHLSTPATAVHVADQKAQVRTVLEHLRPLDEPVLIGGDFNIRATDAASQPFSENNLMQSWIAESGLKDSWRQVNNGADGPTMTSAYGDPTDPNPDRRIDYVYASPAFAVLRGHVSLVDRYASDHLPVVMTLRLPRPTPVRHQSVLAGADGLDGWSQVVDQRGAVSLSVCKNRGTSIDDGNIVRATLRRANGTAIRTLTDGGTSRDRCATDSWPGRIGKHTVLETCLVKDGTALHCRKQPVNR